MRRKLSTDQIYQLRKAGKSMSFIARKAGISRARVAQIIHAQGEDPMPKKVGHEQKRSFAATNLRPAVKDALRVHAERTGQNMSDIIAASIEQTLKDAGVEIIETPVNKGEPLPFEEAV